MARIGLLVPRQFRHVLWDRDNLDDVCRRMDRSLRTGLGRQSARNQIEIRDKLIYKKENN